MQGLANLLRRNLAMKLLALFSAIFLWLYVMNEQNPPAEVSYSVPVEVHNLASDLVVHQLPETVRIRVKGPRSAVAYLKPADMKAVLDLKGLNEGKHAPRFQVNVPSGVELLEIQPNPVPINLEMIISKVVPVELRLNGSPEPQTASVKTNSSVKQVRLEGLRSAVAAVSQVVVTVDASGKDASFEVEAPILALNSEGRMAEGVAIIPDVSHVFVAWSKPQIKKQLDVEAAFQGQLPLGTKITRMVIVPNKVDAQGDKAVLDGMPYISTEIIDLSQVNGNMDRELALQAQPGVAFQPTKVRVQITVER